MVLHLILLVQKKKFITYEGVGGKGRDGGRESTQMWLDINNR